MLFPAQPHEGPRQCLVYTSNGSSKRSVGQHSSFCREENFTMDAKTRRNRIPLAPWQKGTVENTNKRVRRYLPPETVVLDVTSQEICSLCDFSQHLLALERENI
jgi:hypothetical protein